MRVAIVGAGVSGLVVAHLLHPRHEITVFEAAPYAGGHTHTVPVDTDEGTYHVDTGFIVFNDRNYPDFERLLERLHVPWQPTSMSFSVSDAEGRFEYASTSLNGLFATRANALSPAFHRMVAEVPRFQRACRRLLAEDDQDVSLAEWLRRQRFSRAFIERLIVPQAAAVWSAEPRQMWSFPARFLARVLRQPRDALAAGPPPVAGHPGRLGPLCGGADAPVWLSASARHAGRGD